MTVSLLMGWALFALLVLLVVSLVVVTLISGGPGGPVVVGSSPGPEVPVNVFQRGAMAPSPVLSVPGQRSAAPQPGGAGLRPWHRGLGAASVPEGAPAPMQAPSPVDP